MRFIFQLPETTGTQTDMLDVGPLRDVAIAAERAGFYGIALTEHPVPGARWLENGGHQSLDVSGCVVFLASALSCYMTGSTLHPDGGTYASSGWFNWPGSGWANHVPGHLLHDLPPELLPDSEHGH